ncbi:MAG: hypothetical protein QNK36_20320 [Colwellia sp.]|nr:hypothetical protein [Colwellia sp.]
MNNHEEIKINWEGPFTHEDIINNDINHNYLAKGTDIGLYQVYGNHIIYGSNVLLYVGLTTDSFKSRLKNREIITGNNDVENVKIYLGKIFSDKETISKTTEESKIRKAEALIINVLKPACNSQYIGSVRSKAINNDDDFTVLNFGNYKSILPEISTKRWWNDENINYDIVNSVAQMMNKEITNADDWYGFVCDNDELTFFGIEYDIWDKHQSPLIIGTSKEAIKKGRLKKEFNLIGEDKYYHYINVCDDLSNPETIDICIHQINKIQKLLPST